MTYSATYESGDLDDITMDVIGTGLVDLLQFVSLIILVLIFGWFVTKLKKSGVKFK